MFIPLLERLGETFHGSAGVSFLAERASQTANASSASTQQQLAGQWANPNDVLSVLLIIGGDIVQKALAQASGGRLTPVCFSFGWVAYSLNALISIIGDGRLLPEPDHPVKVFNLTNGYVRENKNWVIGRVLRDNIMHLNKTRPIGGNAIRISIYEAHKGSTNPSNAITGSIQRFGVMVMLLQLVIAAVPLGLYREWGIFLITGAGTLLALMAGSLPQWRVEKNPEQTKSKKNFALTSGNGARDIMIIKGNGNCLDLEELAATQMPRSSRTWESHPLFAKQVIENGVPKVHGNGSPYRTVKTYKGIPIGFWVTMTVVSCQFVLWIALLIAVAGLRSHVWYLLAVGGLGMLQNVIVAASSRGPEKRNLNLRFVEVIQTRKVMDGLMDLEVGYNGFGDALRKEFFPGRLDKGEIEWWFEDNKDIYDNKRLKEIGRRGRPRRFLPKYTESFASTQISYDKPEKETKKSGTRAISQWRGATTADRKAEQVKHPISPASAATFFNEPQQSQLSRDLYRSNPSNDRIEIVDNPKAGPGRSV